MKHDLTPADVSYLRELNSVFRSHEVVERVTESHKRSPVVPGGVSHPNPVGDGLELGREADRGHACLDARRKTGTGRATNDAQCPARITAGGLDFLTERMDRRYHEAMADFWRFFALVGWGTVAVLLVRSW